ncbi:preprotein translocase subunit SecA [bacterium endosymbiont of Pedicinus badii]|uniref:preprotein translocase subunit SecA n=1 Tax=bacterium endosymbiont of Pedicinus badii TaxID=1719126 RepID=UPI0009B9FEDC|nr:preprotein translocase subunit SecA [bacterium endosymbiont of Pedicinus badii]OQM34226.1 preprotein translocase subunit SecA [bacterium endosymbiont of Pedicinus badii]
MNFIKKIINKFFGNQNKKIIKKIYKTVEKINYMEKNFQKLKDSDFLKKTLEFKKKIRNGISIDSILPEAFATVREASKRVFGMRHFDVQIIGGIVLNGRAIAEMRTGEGKTLTATLPAYLNALQEKGVHIVTVNDYLAKRDAEQNKSLFEFLGMKVGINLSDMSPKEKRSAYYADITYGNNNEYGFDYLRDNMVFDKSEKVQRGLYYALIDEVDSILIDEARTPLIISGPIEGNSDIYNKINTIVPKLILQKKEDSDNFQGIGHFTIDEKTKQVHFTERGLVFLENIFKKLRFMKENESLYSSNNIILVHHTISALRAHVLFHRNVDYIVKNQEVIIVDEHTGRTMPGRRWSDGLHQAIEAKEKIKVKDENQTLASITFQNYFRLYEKLSGMTGTAFTESFEFKEIYNLNTVVIPTNRPMIRKDFSDLVYMTEKEKNNAIIDDIKNCYKKKQPVLVGTVSIEKSEIISKKLKKCKIPHKVLNAKFHAMEAEIISEAGKPGAVTIATNMAGRGTDIVLGGNWKLKTKKFRNDKKEVKKIYEKWKEDNKKVLLSGGLHVIGTERHESRRIDNQLRGRSGRQGDIGTSRFYISMEDSLMRIFASEKISIILRKIGMNFGESIEHPWITKAIENAQKKVENRNFEIRKQLLEYDDVSNVQRCAIYEQRNEILERKDITDIVRNIRKDVFQKIIKSYFSSEESEKNIRIKEFCNLLKKDFNINTFKKNLLKKISIFKEEKELFDYIIKKIEKNYIEKEKKIGKSFLREFEKNIMLQTLDAFWKEHLFAIDYLRKGIHLRGYAQKDPKQEYKRESFIMFSNMLESLKYEVVSLLSKSEFFIKKV